jgi:hypothetical protein
MTVTNTASTGNCRRADDQGSKGAERGIACATRLNGIYFDASRFTAKLSAYWASLLGWRIVFPPQLKDPNNDVSHVPHGLHTVELSGQRGRSRCKLTASDALYAPAAVRDQFLRALDARDRAESARLAPHLTGCMNPLPGMTCGELGLPTGSTYGSAARRVLVLDCDGVAVALDAQSDHYGAAGGPNV